MGAIAVPIVIVLVALIGATIAATRFVQRRRERTEDMRADRQTLHYTVPAGYDPADVVLELGRYGYEAVPDSTVGRTAELLIGARGDKAPDRERTRRILAEIIGSVPIDQSGGVAAKVHFMDE